MHNHVRSFSTALASWRSALLVLLGQKLLAESLCFSDKRFSRSNEFLNLYYIRGDKILVIVPVSEIKSDVQVPGPFSCEEPWPDKFTMKQCNDPRMTGRCQLLDCSKRQCSVKHGVIHSIQRSTPSGLSCHEPCLLEGFLRLAKAIAYQRSLLLNYTGGPSACMALWNGVAWTRGFSSSAWEQSVGAMSRS